jgi:hypothetical protein
MCMRGTACRVASVQLWVLALVGGRQLCTSPVRNVVSNAASAKAAKKAGLYLFAASV